MSCPAIHPDTGLPCEETEPHPNHAYFSRGWHHWPNEDYVEPPNAKKDISSVAKVLREHRRAVHGDPTPAELRAALSSVPTAPARLRVFNAIVELHPSPVTKNMIALHLSQSRDRTHPRMMELEKDGFIVKTGGIREGTDGDGDLWALTPEALNLLRIQS